MTRGMYPVEFRMHRRLIWRGIMENRIITISREYGSGGREIG